MEREGGLVVRGRVEIDMRQPFRSVKEAISLFGEKVLAGEIYATNKLKETKLNADHQAEKQVISETARNGNAETNENSLKKTNEEGNMMAFYLNSLKQELEETKKELQQLKTRDKKSDHDQEPNPETEEIKFVENSTTTTRSVEEAQTQTEDQQKQEFELEKKRSVKFASPPLLTRMMDDSKDDRDEDEEEEKGVDDFQSPSIEKKKRRKPLFGGLFSKKKGVQKSKSKSYTE